MFQKETRTIRKVIMSTIVLADRHRMFTQSLRVVFEQRLQEFRVVELHSGVEVVEFCRTNHPEVLIVGMSMSDLNGLEVTAEVMRHSSMTKVIMLLGLGQTAEVMNVIKGGAQGYLLKSESLECLLKSVLVVTSGDSYFSPQIACDVAKFLQKRKSNPSFNSLLESLSPREMQVLRLVIEGKTSKEIAHLLDLNSETVRTYRKTMMRKMGIKNVVILTRVAMQAGFLASFDMGE